MQLLLHQARTALNKEIAFKATIDRYPNQMVRTDLLPDPLDIRYEEHYRNSSRKINEVFRKIPDPNVPALVPHTHNTDDENESNILSMIEPIDLRDVSPLREAVPVDAAVNNLAQIVPVDLESIPKPVVADESQANLAQLSDKNNPHVSSTNDNSANSIKQESIQSANGLMLEDSSNAIKDSDKFETPFVQVNESTASVEVNLNDELHSKFLSIDEPIEVESQLSGNELKSEPKEIIPEVSEPKKEETPLSKLDLLEKDPILQKYMDLIAEKRKENTSMIDPDSRLQSFTAKLEVIN